MVNLNHTKKQDILSLHRFFVNEKHKSRGKKYKNVANSIACALNISTSTVYEVLRNKNKAPKSRKPKKQPLDNFDKETVRRVVHELYEKKQLPTLNKIRRRLQQLKIIITRPRLSLELKSLGFKWKKITENRKIFIERPEIRAVRAHYLRTVRQFRRNGYQIVYLDETWVNQNHCTAHTWLPDINCSDLLELISHKELKYRLGKASD